MKLTIGARVQISSEYSWAKGAYGTIREYPDFIEDFAEGDGLLGDCWRLVNTVSGQEKYYWIEFDEPQNDDDGDGPYREAEFPEDMLISQE